MKCDICGKIIWFRMFRTGFGIAGTIMHDKCLEDESNEIIEERT